MASLQDQLLKAGLTTKQKARQANTDKRKKNKQKRSGAKVEVSLQEQVKQDLAKAQQEKQSRDAALNAEKQQQLAAKEQHFRIQQILQHHQVKEVEGDKDYNYTFNNLIKKIYLNDTSYQALVNGRLALCGLDDITYVVTKETADKLAELDENVVLVQNHQVKDEHTEEDDPYAAYQIPDDLMW